MLRTLYDYLSNADPTFHLYDVLEDNTEAQDRADEGGFSGGGLQDYRPLDTSSRKDGYTDDEGGFIATSRKEPAPRYSHTANNDDSSEEGDFKDGGTLRW